MSEDIFPIGRYSRNDVEAELNNSIDTTFQTVNTANPSTFLKSYYGMNFVVGTGSAGVLTKWVPFQKPINNIVTVFTQCVGLTATTTPTGVLGLGMPAFTNTPAIDIIVAGIQSGGFSAKLCSANVTNNSGNFLNNSAYVFTWHAIARVR